MQKDVRNSIIQTALPQNGHKKQKNANTLIAQKGNS